MRKSLFHVFKKLWIVIQDDELHRILSLAAHRQRKDHGYIRGGADVHAVDEVLAHSLDGIGLESGENFRAADVLDLPGEDAHGLVLLSLVVIRRATS